MQEKRTEKVQKKRKYRIEKGAFIAIEGLDGAGLSTHARKLADKLRELVSPFKVKVTKEPTFSPIGHIIWSIIMGHYPQLNRPDILALLFAADRVYHLYAEPANARKPYEQSGVMGAIKNGYIVISDRYKYSSYAYQQVAQAGIRLDLDWIKTINKFAESPDIVVFLDVPPKIAFYRISYDRWQFQLFEEYERMQEVYENFIKVFTELQRKGGEKNGKPRLIWVKGYKDEKERSVEEVAEEILEKVVNALVEMKVLTPEDSTEQSQTEETH